MQLRSNASYLHRGPSLLGNASTPYVYPLIDGPATPNISADSLLDSQWRLRHTNGSHNHPSSIVSCLVSSNALEKKRCGRNGIWESGLVRYAFSTLQEFFFVFFAWINILTKSLELSRSQLGESTLSVQSALAIKLSRCTTATYPLPSSLTLLFSSPAWHSSDPLWKPWSPVVWQLPSAR